MQRFLFVLSKVLAVFCWVVAVFTAIGNLNAQAELVPYGLFNVVLWTYWGYVLWKNDKREITINGFVFALLIIAIFVAEFFVCMFIGATISGLVANFNPEVTGWIFAILMSFCVVALPPSKLLPKKFYVAANPVSQTVSEGEIDSNQKESQSWTAPTPKQFEESDHSKYMPQSNNEE